jgi:hypothetical protein
MNGFRKTRGHTLAIDYGGKRGVTLLLSTTDESNITRAVGGVRVDETGVLSFKF